MVGNPTAIPNHRHTRTGEHEVVPPSGPKTWRVSVSSADSPTPLTAPLHRRLGGSADRRLIHTLFSCSFRLVFRAFLWCEACPLVPNAARRVTGARVAVGRRNLNQTPGGSPGGSGARIPRFSRVPGVRRERMTHTPAQSLRWDMSPEKRGTYCRTRVLASQSGVTERNVAEGKRSPSQPA
jgi:hypothetical protein